MPSPPDRSYINGIAGPTSDYDWHFYTANQTSLGNRPIYWPRGKLLGGSSAVNGVVSPSLSQRPAHQSTSSFAPT